MSIWNDNAARFATTTDQSIAWIRNEAVRQANRLRTKEPPLPDLAHAVMLAALERQARLAGIRDVHLPRSTP